MLVNEATWNFIRRHAQDDVRRLALQGSKHPEVDMPMALQQIAGRQTARRKLPVWAATEGIIYPPHLNMEQCSSEQTARYKAQIAGRGKRMADLTGGFGVDFYWMSQGFEERCYVEQDEALCAIAEANMATLHLPCSVSCCTATDFLSEMPHASLIYLDPARRNEYGARTYGIEDCTPNVLQLLPLLMQKADCVMLKLSPMLDWHQAVVALKYVTEVHIVSVGNECKELILLLSHQQTDRLRVVCVNGTQVFEFFSQPGKNNSLAREQIYRSQETIATADESTFLYEPNASIMKAGCFDLLDEQFPCRQVAPNSHLFLSAGEIIDFPGRGFRILAVSSANKQELRKKFSESLAPLKSANITVRNFPMTADELRKKLKLKDGGDVYIFATTLQNGIRQLLICRKIS